MMHFPTLPCSCYEDHDLLASERGCLRAGVGCRYLGSHTSKDPFQDRAKEILCNKAQGKGNSPQTEGKQP